MATPGSPPYTYQRPSTMETRSLVSNPKVEPSYTTAAATNTAASERSVPSSPEDEKPTLWRPPTNNYQEALAAASGNSRSRTGNASVDEDDARGADVGVPARRLSYDLRDMRRRATYTQLGADRAGAGYSTTEK